MKTQPRYAMHVARTIATIAIAAAGLSGTPKHPSVEVGGCPHSPRSGMRDARW